VLKFPRQGLAKYEMTLGFVGTTEMNTVHLLQLPEFAFSSCASFVP
jgi:hypothetical protein